VSGTDPISANPSANAPGTVIAYRNVSFRYASTKADEGPLTLSDITFNVRAGERLGVLGPNGGGKSTLLKLTLGLLKGHTGEIEIAGLPPREACRRGLVGYVPQKIEAELRFPLSVAQVVAMPLMRDLPPWKGRGPDIDARVREALAVVGASDLIDRPIGALSGGQLQRVMIARAIAPKPAVLLLDEPTVGIDVVGQQQFSELMRRISTEFKLTVVVVSHDLRTIAAGCDRVACLSRTLHFHDAPGGLTPALLAELFRHDVAAIFGGNDRAWHIDAHKADACPHPEHRHPHEHAGPCTDDHTHETPHASGPATLSISAPRSKPSEGPR